MKNFFGGDYLDELDKKILANRVLWFTVFTLSGFLFLITLSYFSLANNVSVKVSIPPYDNYQIKVKKDNANEEYFLLWGSYLAGQLTFLDKNCANDRMTSLILKLSPSVYTKHKAELTNLIKQIVKNDLTLHFNKIKESVEIDKDGIRAKYESFGIASKTIAGIEQAPKECSVKISLNYLGGEVYVTGINSDCI